MSDDFDYCLSSSDDEAVPQKRPNQTGQTSDDNQIIYFTPELAKRFLVNGEKTPSDYLQEYPKNGERDYDIIEDEDKKIKDSSSSSSSSEKLSDNDFDGDDEIIDHDRVVQVIDAENALSTQKFVLPQSKEVKKISRRAAAAALAAFAYASYKTFFDVRRLIQVQTA